MRNITVLADVIAKNQEEEVSSRPDLFSLFLDVYQQKAKLAIEAAKKKAQEEEFSTLAGRKELFLAEIIKESHQLCQELARDNITIRRFARDLRQMLEALGQLDRQLTEILK